jgi:hypothetical protein
MRQSVIPQPYTWFVEIDNQPTGREYAIAQDD